jgi:hypothetical protein
MNLLARLKGCPTVVQRKARRWFTSAGLLFLFFVPFDLFVPFVF